MSESSLRTTSETDWNRVSALTDAEIDTSDVPPLDEAFFANATLHASNHPLVEVTLHVDAQLLDWFRERGGDVESRINAALRLYVEAHARYSS